MEEPRSVRWVRPRVFEWLDELEGGREAPGVTFVVRDAVVVRTTNAAAIVREAMWHHKRQEA